MLNMDQLDAHSRHQNMTEHSTALSHRLYYKCKRKYHTGIYESDLTLSMLDASLAHTAGDMQMVETDKNILAVHLDMR